MERGGGWREGVWEVEGVEEEVEEGRLVAKDISTGFLERFLPLCMCLSQYLESG